MNLFEWIVLRLSQAIVIGMCAFVLIAFLRGVYQELTNKDN